MVQDYKLVENEGLFQEYLEMGRSNSLYVCIRGGHRISGRGGRDLLGTKLFQELGTNLKKKAKKSRKNVQNL